MYVFLHSSNILYVCINLYQLYSVESLFDNMESVLKVKFDLKGRLFSRKRYTNVEKESPQTVSKGKLAALLGIEHHICRKMTKKAGDAALS